MSSLNRRRSSDRSGERVEFRFSNLRAVQVPVVSDRLLLSIISADTGKTFAKSSKAAARNGICQWPDSILESVWFSQDEASKEFEDCQCRIVVSMGSTKTGILGEVFLNLTNYLSSVDSTAISLPLKKCSTGTVLQLKIQCLGTKSKSSGMKQLNELSPRFDGHSSTIDDMDSESVGSDSMFSRTRSLLGNQLGGVHQDEAGNRDASFHSGDSTMDRTNSSPRDDSDGGLYMGRQDSASIYSFSARRGDLVSRSNNSSFSSPIPGQNMLQESNAQSSLSGLAHLSSGASGSSKDLLDAAEATIEELLDEAQMWERHARQLKNDLERLQKECDEKSKKQSELLLELSVSQAERDSLRQETEELKTSLEVAAGITKSGDVIDVQHELKDEVQFVRESNENLTAQLTKTQDANIELVSILQELEETIEAQRVEISNFSHMSNVIDHEVSENALSVQEIAELERNLSLKEDEIIELRDKLDRILNIENSGGAGSDAVYIELERENDFLKGKIQELENDCSELTEENLELIYKLKEVSGVDGQDSCVPDSQELPDVGDLSETSTSQVKHLERKCADLELKMLIFRSESRELENKFQKCQAELKERTLELSELRENLSSFHATDLEGGEISTAKGSQLRSEEVGHTESELNSLTGRVQLKEKEIEDLQHSRLEKVTVIDSHVAANKVLERKICDLQSCKVELELHISKLENEKIELSESISGLEAQLSEKESCILQMGDSKALIIYLKDKVEQHQAEIEAQKLDLKQKQLEFQRRFSEVQEDSEALKRLNAKLQATVDSLVEECSSLQTLTADLKKQKLELHSCATKLEQELEHSKRKITEFCRTVEFLKTKLSSIQKDISSKEQYFLSELENIFQDHKELKERINHAHFLLNKIEKEKIVEVENLEREVMSLTTQVSSTHEGQESAIMDAIREASMLRADKAKLEANLHGVNEELRHYKSQLGDIREESKSKIKSLADSLNASKQNEEILKTDVEDMRRIMEIAKSNEENLRKTTCELELKFKSSDYEKQQIMHENSGLKIQVQKIAGLQDELLKLQSSLDEAKFEKRKLEELLKLLSEECEELKAQKGMLPDKVSHRHDTLNDLSEEGRSNATMQANNDKNGKKGNNDLATDNGGCSPVNEEPDLQTKVQLLESRLAKALEENSMYKTQLISPMREGQPDGTGAEENNGDRLAQLESELKDMQHRLLNMSMQYAEVEAQREELVMELKNVNAKKGRWF